MLRANDYTTLMTINNRSRVIFRCAGVHMSAAVVSWKEFFLSIFQLFQRHLDA